MEGSSRERPSPASPPPEGCTRPLPHPPRQVRFLSAWVMECSERCGPDGKPPAARPPARRDLLFGNDPGGVSSPKFWHFVLKSRSGRGGRNRPPFHRVPPWAQPPPPSRTSFSHPPQEESSAPYAEQVGPNPRGSGVLTPLGLKKKPLASLAGWHTPKNLVAAGWGCLAGPLNPRNVSLPCRRLILCRSEFGMSA